MYLLYVGSFQFSLFDFGGKDPKYQHGLASTVTQTARSLILLSKYVSYTI